MAARIQKRRGVLVVLSCFRHPLTKVGLALQRRL
jgi:hypothetical protein